MRYLDATSIAILLPTAVLLALIVSAYKKQLKPREIPSLPGAVSIETEIPSRLQIYDPPLSEEEARFVTNSKHGLELHGKRVLVAGCFGAFLFGTTASWLTMYQSDFVFAVCAISMLLIVYAFFGMVAEGNKSCQCGAIRLLTSKSRLDRLWIKRSYSTFSLKRELLSLSILIPICCAIMALVVGSTYLSFQLCNFLFPGVRVATCAGMLFPTLVIGVLGIAVSLSNPAKGFFTKEQLDRISTLPGNSPDELSELIEFYSSIGNYKKTDEYTKKLLLVAEQPTVESAADV